MLLFLRTLPLKIALGLFWWRAFANSLRISMCIVYGKYAKADELLRSTWLLDPNAREEYELLLDMMWRNRE